MAAPAPTTRVTPTGIKLDDGFQTLVTIERFPSINLWEKTVQPPGLDAGDAIETTTMHNSVYRTMAPRQLITLTEMKIQCAYDPGVYAQILQAVGVNDEITVRFPDGSTLAFWGFMKDFVPADASEGTQPEAAVTIVPTNRDNAGAEQAPVLASVSGT